MAKGALHQKWLLMQKRPCTKKALHQKWLLMQKCPDQV